jgi:YbbR domain-containing protein
MQGSSLERGKKRIRAQIPRIFNNIGLKIISLVLAACLWFFVTYYQDPETVLTVNNVPVKMLHTDMLESEGKVYIVLNDSDNIPVVTVNAPRSVVDALEADNIVATADVEDMSAENTVPIVLTTNKYSDSITNISGSINSVRLSIEDEERATFGIEATVVGNVAEGYQIGSVSLEQNQVRVKGPASVVQSVKNAGVSVDVSEAESTISTNSEIHLYDEDGRDLEIDKDLTLNIDKVMVKVEVLATKEIPVKIAVSGTPADGFRLTGETQVEPGRIRIAGKKSAVDAVTAVNIPSSELNVTGRNKNLVKTIDVSEYLGSGVELADGENGKIKITVEIVGTEDE